MKCLSRMNYVEKVLLYLNFLRPYTTLPSISDLAKSSNCFTKPSVTFLRMVLECYPVYTVGCSLYK